MTKLQLIFLLPLNLAALPLTAQNRLCDTITWSASRQLTLADFRGVPDTTSKIGALSFISIRYSLENIKDDHHLTVLNYFEPCNSWFKTVDSTLSLLHEQIHFDIDEYIRRSFVKEVILLNNFSRYAFPGIKDLYFTAMNNRNFLHKRYDIETDFHRNIQQEKIWSIKIINLVLELDDFKAQYYKLKGKRNTNL